MKQKRKGFTLVELIVVIAIIGILAAVLIPTFSGAIESARKADDRLTVSNMNKTLTAYLAYHQIDAKDLDASEVQYIVSTEEEQYTFQPAYSGGVFWYNSNAGRIEYAETMGNPATTIGGTAALADGPAGAPTSIEDVYGNGYLYLNAGGELATFLLNLRNLGSVQDYANLASAVYEDGTETPKQIEGVDVSAVYEEFDPAQTLYINSTGGFIDTASYTSNTYSNKPVYEGGAWKINGQEIYFDDYTPTGTETVVLASSMGESLKDGKDYWAIKVSGSPNYYIAYRDSTYNQVIVPEQNVIKNVVYATGLRVVPALNIGVNIAMEEDITLPATVYTVMPNAFTEVTSETRLVAKSQYAEVITGALGANMTTAIAEKTTDSLMSNVENGNNLLKVYLVKHSVAQTEFLGFIPTGYNTLTTLKEVYSKDGKSIVNAADLVFDEEAEGKTFVKRGDQESYPDMISFGNTSGGGFIGKINLTHYKNYVYSTGTTATNKADAEKYVQGDTVGYFLVGGTDTKQVTYQDNKEKNYTQPLYRLYLDTSELVKAFPTIHTIDVKYTPRYETRTNTYKNVEGNKNESASFPVQVYDITIQAFDNSGMCLNMVVTYEMA